MGAPTRLIVLTGTNRIWGSHVSVPNPASAVVLGRSRQSTYRIHYCLFPETIILFLIFCMRKRKKNIRWISPIVSAGIRSDRSGMAPALTFSDFRESMSLSASG